MCDKNETQLKQYVIIWDFCCREFIALFCTNNLYAKQMLTSDSLVSIIARITLRPDLATIQVQPSLISDYITHAGIQRWKRAFRSSQLVESDVTSPDSRLGFDEK